MDDLIKTDDDAIPLDAEEFNPRRAIIEIHLWATVSKKKTILKDESKKLLNDEKDASRS